MRRVQRRLLCGLEVLNVGDIGGEQGGFEDEEESH